MCGIHLDRLDRYIHNKFRQKLMPANANKNFEWKWQDLWETLAIASAGIGAGDVINQIRKSNLLAKKPHREINTKFNASTPRNLNDYKIESRFLWKETKSGNKLYDWSLAVEIQAPVKSPACRS